MRLARSILYEHDCGRMVSTIARRFNIGTAYVEAVLASEGITPRHAPDRFAAVRARGEAMARMWRSNDTLCMADIARRFGVSERQARYAIRTHGGISSDALRERGYRVAAVKGGALL